MSIEEIHRLFLESSVVCTDSRKITPNCVYVSLKGDRFDGNDYALQALNDGASYAIVDKAFESQEKGLIQVADALLCLQQLANYHRKYLGIPMVAITGSNGKTTTKELCGSVLSAKYNLLITEGNFNNHIGVPLTLLNGRKEHELAVIEMGANHQKEIAELCRIAEPNAGLITNIGKAHMEGMGGISGVLKAKTELFDFLLENDGAILLNLDESKLEKFTDKAALTYGSAQDSEINGTDMDNTGKLTVKWKVNDEEFITSTKLMGVYNLGNVLSAVAIGIFFNVPAEDIDRAISEYTPSNNRSELQIEGSNAIIWDAYNANPTSMKAALANIAGMEHPSKVLILGEMKEIGPTSFEEHQALIDEALKLKPKSLILVGDSFDKCNRQGATWTSEVSNLKHHLAENPIENSLLLIKGSRSNKLEELKSVLNT